MSDQQIALEEISDGRSAYERWMDAEGIPVVGGLAVEDLMSVRVDPWERYGAYGAFIDLMGAEQENGAYVLELAPGSQIKPQRHLYEEVVFVVGGSGATSVWLEGDQDKVTFEWSGGSLFSVPLNAYHQHFNLQNTPCRLFAVTTASTVINLFHNLDFVFESDFEFKDRFAGARDHFSGAGRRYKSSRKLWATNFVPDVKVFELEPALERGPGNDNVTFEIGENTLAAHISSFPSGMYKKAHKHPGGAHVVIVDGVGYSLMWPEGGPVHRVNWHAGSLLVPPTSWYHQHFNLGDNPARYLAIRWGSRKHPYKIGYRRDKAAELGEGVRQIEYEDEDPSIRRAFEEELAKQGVPSRM